MDKPTAFVYKTAHKVIETDSPSIITVQGIKCLDGGIIKQGKKFVPYMVRLDNKPELVAALEAYQKSVDEYNAWFAEQVETIKATIKTSGPGNFTEAENDEFSWSYWDGTDGNTLRDKLNSNREIYQMKYTDNFEVITGEKKQKVMAFWRALDAIKDDIKAAAKARAKAWANSPEGKAEAETWERHEKLMREMDRADSDY